METPKIVKKSKKTSSKSKKSKKTKKNIDLTVTKTKRTYKKKLIKTILTSRGYSIIKEHFGFRDINRTKRELTVSPYVNENYAAKPRPFPVYLESQSKIYLPKHYGIETFGDPDKVKEIAKGNDIELEFKGSLRPKQLAPVKAFMDSCEAGSLSMKSNGGIISIVCGGGKCIGKNEEVMMADGTKKFVQNILVGDKIMGDDSTPRTILSLARGREQMYRVVPKKGKPYVVNESHILSLKCSCKKSRYPKGTKVDMSVKDYLALPKSYHGPAGPLLGYRVPVEFPEKEIDMEPYALGYWLGDGDSCGVITTEEQPVVDYFKNYVKKINCYLNQGKDSKTTRNSLHYKISGNKVPGKKIKNKFLDI